MIDCAGIIDELKKRYGESIIKKLELYKYLLYEFKDSTQKLQNINEFIEVVFEFLDKTCLKDIIYCCNAAEIILDYYRKYSFDRFGKTINNSNLLEKIIENFKKDKNKFIEEINICYKDNYWQF